MELLRTELVSRRTRSEFRDHCSGFAVIRSIERAFQDEGFGPAPDAMAPEDGWARDGQRRGVFDRYTVQLDWSDPEVVRRALSVFEQMLAWCEDDEFGRPQRESLIGLLERDGYSVTPDGRIQASDAARLAEIPLDGLTDPRSIIEHLDRISAVTDADPALAISGARALIEATTKAVLKELGAQYDEKADIPVLVKAAQKALKLHPDTLAPSKEGRETIIRILSNLSQVAIGVSELRNAYGTDHGRSAPTVGLGPRHAHLAVGAASTYVRMLLETLEARRASG